MFLTIKNSLVLLLFSVALTASAQKTVMKYDADMIVKDKEMSGILIHSKTDSSNRFVFVSKLGLKFFDVEVGKTDFDFTVHYFSPAFKTEKRMIGVAKEMFVLGFNDDIARKNSGKVRFIHSKSGSCKAGFGLFGKRVKVCYLDSHTTVSCKFYPVKFDLRVLH